MVCLVYSQSVVASAKFYSNEKLWERRDWHFLTMIYKNELQRWIPLNNTGGVESIFMLNSLHSSPSFTSRKFSALTILAAWMSVVQDVQNVPRPRQCQYTNWPGSITPNTSTLVSSLQLKFLCVVFAWTWATGPGGQWMECFWLSAIASVTSLCWIAKA